jgi:hypothetical protein
MIGRIRFQWAGEGLTAELSDDLEWSCDHPAYGVQLARWLQGLFEPRDDLSPSRGRPGYKALDDAATWLEGTIEGLSEPEGDDIGRIY